MPGFWKRRKQVPEVPLRDIIEHFNAAAGNEEHFPASIDPRIYHVKVILDHFGDLGGKRVLDAGCGKGRFARVFLETYPTARFVGLDIAEAMLRSTPPSMAPCSGSLTALPFGSERFDCAYATESLEHAVDIEGAVTELCRVVKPGGRIAIIDKNAAQWGRLETPTWEKWFDQKEMEKLLRRKCRSVRSFPISYWEDVAPDGLFLAWLAER